MLWQGTQNISLECLTLCALTRTASRENPRVAVQKLWMPAFPCGKRWKSWVEIQWDADATAQPIDYIREQIHRHHVNSRDRIILSTSQG